MKLPAISRWICAPLSLLPLVLPTSSLAIDGTPHGLGLAGPPPTYYEGVYATASPEQLQSQNSEIPTQLQISPSSATATYTTGALPGQWVVQIRDFLRTHEQIETVYHMILALPLPAGADGNAGFRALQRSIPIKEGDGAAAVPMIYGGEKIALKQNVSLEKQVLGSWVGSGPNQLPDLAGTGYRYTLWDTVVTWDPEYGDIIQALADLRYQTGAGVAAPDAGDARLKAFSITWIPTLDPSIPPFAVEIDIVPSTD